MKKEERYERILAHFRAQMPNVNTELEFGSVFQLLVAVILSAQCTDKRINQVTPDLFRRYPDAKAMAQAEPEDVLEYINSVSYPNAKAAHLVAMARALVAQHGGEVPSDMKATLAVDTHVYRVAHRLGLVSKRANTPFKVEQELVKHIPEADIPDAHHWLLLHGRYVCTSRKPHCERCDFADICPKEIEGSKLG